VDLRAGLDVRGIVGPEVQHVEVADLQQHVLCHVGRSGGGAHARSPDSASARRRRCSRLNCRVRAFSRAFSCGLVISSRPKLIIAVAKPIRAMASPGGRKNHQWPRRIEPPVCAWLTMVPQVISLVEPRPRKASEASMKIPATTALRNMEEMTPPRWGTTSTAMMRGVDSPMVRRALVKSRLR